MPLDLLPQQSTAFERALQEATDFYDKISPSIDAARGLKILNPPPSFLPFLIYEYGLGELTPYVVNLYDLIDEGIRWQRVRGTPQALSYALAWVGYTARLEEAPPRRRRWNAFQLELDRIRDSEDDLARIEGVARLSVPMRSYLARGFKGYDIRALEYGHGAWGNKLWSDYSGVRIDPEGAKWSFSRKYESDHAMSEAELTALGVWLPPVGPGNVTWGAFPWLAAPWGDEATRARSAAMVEAVFTDRNGRPAWAVFKDGDGAVIGYRRARAFHRVAPNSNGQYKIGSTSYGIVSSSATSIYVEALTDFGDGFGTTAATVGFLAGAEPVVGNPLGSLWLPPGGLSVTGPIFAEKPFSIQFGRTVRERVSAVLRF
ncbi:phage tail protein [Microvirga brassicacearum]|uniref:Phage tail protein n=1 Tax=Microvirga brassicacearum TaxID=2580413 RepID=A0A5N3PH65_9HYPH|nr:phage tail protein [Microvirga brassicacearum]KAB0269067.1 hypothetical protein FEZ63_02870 [Microvirga brassicacearum]